MIALGKDDRCPVCQIKTHHYKRAGLFFCSRCCRSFAASNNAWVANWAWVTGPEDGPALVASKPSEAYAKVTGPWERHQLTPEDRSRPSPRKGVSTDAWPPEKIARLRKLWISGVSVAEIGRQLRASKNAIVGKAHRVGLPPRSSPIVRRTTPPAVKAKRMKATGSTLPPLQSETT